MLLLPGDEVRTKCVYKSLGKNVTTVYGLSTQDEMCFAFLTYHPREAVIKDASCKIS